MVSIFLVSASLFFPCFTLAQIPCAADQGRIDAETTTFAAETQKFVAETSSAEHAWIVAVLQILLPSLAIALTVILGFKQLSAQHEAQVSRAKVDVALKAAEIAMVPPIDSGPCSGSV